MDTVRRYVFESPLNVIIALAIVEVAVVWAWRSRRTRRRAWALLPAPALALALGLTAALVRTDREQIASALKAIAAATESGDIDSAAIYVDPDCRSPGPGRTLISKAVLLEIGRRALDRWQVSDVRVSGVKTNLAGPNATTELRTRVRFRSQGVQQWIFIGWRVQWAKRPAGWRVMRVEVTYPEFMQNLQFRLGGALPGMPARRPAPSRFLEGSTTSDLA